MPSTPAARDAIAKVPEVTLGFWVIKILATTLGETGGDAVSMSMGLGYLVGTAIFFALFVVAVLAQIRADRFRPWLYWATIIASTTVGTTLADYADRSLGIGYAGGSALLAGALAVSFLAWHRSVGSLDIAGVSSPRSEVFYWLTIMCSQTLGTALGDWTADDAGLGYLGGALVFGGAIVLIALAATFTRLSRTALFWAAFVLSRPLGATLGDLLDKPVVQGGLALSRYGASAVLLASEEWARARGESIETVYRAMTVMDKPVLMVEIKTNTCRALERAMHAILDARGKKVLGGGAEWFKTNRDEVLEIYSTDHLSFSIPSETIFFCVA